MADPITPTKSDTKSDLETNPNHTMSTSSYPFLQLTMENSNRRNFRERAQSVKLVIDYPRNKKPTATNSSALHRWSSRNSMITAWLIQLMMPTIGKNYLFLPTAKDVWKIVFEGEDSSQIFEKKNYRIINKEIVSLWQELKLSFEEEWVFRW